MEIRYITPAQVGSMWQEEEALLTATKNNNTPCTLWADYCYKSLGDFDNPPNATHWILFGELLSPTEFKVSYALKSVGYNLSRDLCIFCDMHKLKL